MGGVGGNANGKCQPDSCWPGIVAKVAGMGRPSGAPHQGRPHNGHREPGRVVAAYQNLCHAFGEEVCIWGAGLLQVLLDLHTTQRSQERVPNPPFQTTTP